MSIRRRIVFASVATALLVGSAGPALAGEVTGNGKDVPFQSKSVCAFSGLNDELTPFEPTKVQNYGVFKNVLGYDFLPSPGVACNPTSGFEE